MIRLNDPDPYITSVKYLYERTPSRRQLKITLSNGTVVRAEACYESWQQWGGTERELWITIDCVENHNHWLHGGGRPPGMEKGYDLHEPGDCNPVFGRR